MHDLARHRRQDVATSLAPCEALLRRRADLAWAFLRRDPDYRRAYEGFVARGSPVISEAGFAQPWGLAAPADPDLEAEPAGVFWRSEISPAVVVDLEVSPIAAGFAVDLRSSAWPRRRIGSDLLLRAPHGLQVWVRGGRLDQPLAVVAPLADDFDVRLRTLVLLKRALRGQAPPQDFTDQQRTRLGLALRALDHRLAGRSLRETAVALFGEDAAAWKTSSLRDTTLRLVRQGEHLRRGGYRRLLRERPRLLT